MTRVRLRRFSRRLAVESLERRDVPATWGIAWADPQHVTASFVPDGTPVPGQTSHLFRTLDSQLGAGKWEPTILNALQTWAVNSNINVGVVADGGQPLGVAGPAQGDARFGDIRISAEPLPADVVAITSPYSPANGTLSGDIILNSSDDFNPADPGSYDLFTVALHEAGHVFGFADSSDSSSFMYNVYQGPKTALPAGAIPALQSLYGGPRTIDSIDGNQVGTNSTDGNQVNTNSTRPILVPAPPAGSTSVSLAGDLASAQESDYFAFKAPSMITAPNGVDVQVLTSGISLLAPRVTVRDSFGLIVATAAATGPLDGGASVHLDGLLAGQNYTVQVQGATGNAFSVGSYEMTVASTGSVSSRGNPTAGAVAIKPPAKNYDGSTPLTIGASITQNHQADVYSFQTPSSTPNGLTVSLQDWGVGLKTPGITIYSSLGIPVMSAVATDANNPAVSLHLAAISPSATYFVRVENGTINPIAFGNYQLAVGFAATSSGGSSSNFTLATPWFGSSDGKGKSTGSSNSSLAAAATLQTPAGEAPHSRYLAIQGIDSTQVQQFYKLNAPNLPAGQSGVMTVSVQTLSSTGLLPWIGVFDKNGNAVSAQVLVEQDGIAVVQVTPTSSGAQYYLEVSSAQVGGPQAAGNYYLDVTFGNTPATIGPISAGTLASAPAGSSTAQVSTYFSTDQSELFSFVLAGSASYAGTDAVLRMTLVDSSGRVVATLSTPANLAASLTVCLPLGKYTILIGATSHSGQPIPALGYTLSGTNLTDPIRVYSSSGAGSSGTRI